MRSFYIDLIYSKNNLISTFKTCRINEAPILPAKLLFPHQWSSELQIWFCNCWLMQLFIFLFTCFVDILSFLDHSNTGWVLSFIFHLELYLSLNLKITHSYNFVVPKQSKTFFNCKIVEGWNAAMLVIAMLS